MRRRQHAGAVLLLLASHAAAVVAMALFPPPNPPKLVLLDRDGVINEDVGAPGVIDKEQFLLTPGCARAVGQLQISGCKVAVVTNQSCVGKGLIGASDLQEIHALMEQLLLEGDECAMIDRIYACTSTNDADPRKKPNPDMITAACKDFGVAPAECVFIGDTLSDMQAAKAGGVPHRILVETGYGYGLMGERKACDPAQVVEGSDTLGNDAIAPHLKDVAPFLYAANLADAVGFIVRCG